MQILPNTKNKNTRLINREIQNPQMSQTTKNDHAHKAQKTQKQKHTQLQTQTIEQQTTCIKAWRHCVATIHSDLKWYDRVRYGTSSDHRDLCTRAYHPCAQQLVANNPSNTTRNTDDIVETVDAVESTNVVVDRVSSCSH